ncbi:hypothetical protein M758_5G072600 [Ceratodon purpureus]|nr:hypothetical protein M758_5G072600 [Ceratodon purpureus]
MAMEVEVAIVGGGLGGLALAIGLQERGIRAHVFEKAPKVRPHTGTVITLAANGIKALNGIKPGLGEAFLRDGHYVNRSTLVFRHHSEPERVLHIPWPFGALLMTPWRCAQEVLAAEITDHTLLHWRHSFRDFNIVEGGVEARFEVAADEDTEGLPSIHTKVVRAKVLVGVDGIQSQVRKALVGDEPRDLLLVTWNAVVPAEDVRPLNLHEERAIKFMRITNKDREKTVFLLDAGAGLSMWLVRVPDVKGEITKAYSQDLEHHGRDVRKVRALRQMEGGEGLENMRTAMEGTHPDAVREARACDRLPLTTWSDPSKRVVLLGDDMRRYAYLALRRFKVMQRRVRAGLTLSPSGCETYLRRRSGSETKNLLIG